MHVQNQIRYVLSDARTPEALLGDLRHELMMLRSSDPAKIDTTLLVHPGVLVDFLDFNDFSDLSEALLEDLGLTDEIQIATFHPQYQFAGSQPDDIENYSNRSPYPTLHLLRQTSLTTAIDRFGDTTKIFEDNARTLRALGLDGWKKLNI